jgi:hypothetical protein
VSSLSVSLLNVYFWACLAEVARDYAWKEPKLALYSDYLDYPLEITGLSPQRNQDAA